MPVTWLMARKLIRSDGFSHHPREGGDLLILRDFHRRGNDYFYLHTFVLSGLRSLVFRLPSSDIPLLLKIYFNIYIVAVEPFFFQYFHGIKNHVAVTTQVKTRMLFKFSIF